MDENKLLDLKFSQTNIVYKDVTLMAMWAVPQLNFIKNSVLLPVQKLSVWSQPNKTLLNNHHDSLSF